MEDKKIITHAMQIILHAGDARNFVNDAVNKALNDDFEACDKLLEEANKELTEAHAVQTKVLQDVASGELEETYSVLFTHAQDTLMTVYSEYNTSKKIIDLARKIDNQIKKMEKNNA